MLYYPSLTHLRALFIACEFEELASVALNGDKASPTPQPTRLESLKVNLCDNTFPIIQDLITESPLESTSTLQALIITGEHAYHYLREFEGYFTSNVTTFSFQDCYNSSSDTAIVSVGNLIRSASKLSHLRLNELNPFSLFHILRSFNGHLKTLDLDVFDDVEGSIWEDAGSILWILNDETRTGTSKWSSLTWIKFTPIFLARLKSIDGWNELATAFNKNGTEILPREYKMRLQGMEILDQIGSVFNHI